jgi:integrase/recombinase XerD
MRPDRTLGPPGIAQHRQHTADRVPDISLSHQNHLRASELTGLRCSDVHLGTGAHVSVHGKGRGERITPLTNHTRTVLRAWLAERDGMPSHPLFPTGQGGRLSRDALERRLSKYLAIAGKRCPTLAAKTVSMHTLRHTAAMRLLRAGVDSTVIALWLGHQSVDTTKIYLHADLELEQKAIARTTPPDSKPGRYRPPDNLLAFLQNL